MSPRQTIENTVILLSYDEDSLIHLDDGNIISKAWVISKKRLEELKYVALVKSQTADSYLFGEITGYYRCSDRKISLIFVPVNGPVVTVDDHKHKNWPGFDGQKKYVAYHPPVAT